MWRRACSGLMAHSGNAKIFIGFSAHSASVRIPSTVAKYPPLAWDQRVKCRQRIDLLKARDDDTRHRTAARDQL
jgi:hypothetical protein